MVGGRCCCESARCVIDGSHGVTIPVSGAFRVLISVCGVIGWSHGGLVLEVPVKTVSLSVRGVIGWLHGGRVSAGRASCWPSICLQCPRPVARRASAGGSGQDRPRYPFAVRLTNHMADR